MKLIANLAEIDRQAAEDFGIPGLRLMERAGQRVAQAVLAKLDGLSSKSAAARVVIVCGPGNNGGDGFVCARLLAERGGLDVAVVHTAEAYSGDAGVNFKRLQKSSVNLLFVDADDTPPDRLIEEADVLVDALFGSGLSRDVNRAARALIRLMNQGALERVIAVDVPSGIDGATGQVRGIAVRAALTVTFAAAKPGLYLYPGKAHAGAVQVVDIGLPAQLVASDPSSIRLTTRAQARAWIPHRAPDGHKYTFGSVLVIAGSRTMPGTAALVSEAALASGAGIVTLAAPQSVFQQVAVIPEIVRLPLPETPEGFLNDSALAVLTQALADRKFHTLAIGPGLGQASETVIFLARLLNAVLKDTARTLVLDADALNALARLKSLPEAPAVTLNERVILTPHVGECARLLGEEGKTISVDLVSAASRLQGQFGAQVVLKSAASVSAGTDGLLWINPTGNSGMATAGSGDVLTGLIAGLLAQGVSPTIAGALGAYLHGLAGDLAADVYSQYALKASQITEGVGPAFLDLLAPQESPS